jgi:hypothetical protein
MISPDGTVDSVREVFGQGDLTLLQGLVERAGASEPQWALMLRAAEDAAWLDWVADQAVAAGAWTSSLDALRAERLSEMVGEPPF